MEKSHSKRHEQVDSLLFVLAGSERALLTEIIEYI